jgi:hypothetical protein
MWATRVGVGGVRRRAWGGIEASAGVACGEVRHGGGRRIQRRDVGWGDRIGRLQLEEGERETEVRLARGKVEDIGICNFWVAHNQKNFALQVHGCQLYH